MNNTRIILALLLTTSVACGGPKDNNNNGIDIKPRPDMPKDTGNKDMPDADMPKTDMPDMDMGKDADSDADTDMDTKPGMGVCANRIDWGELDTSAAKTEKFTVSNVPELGQTPINGTATSCGFGNASERAMTFTVSGHARIQATLSPKSALNWALELRKGDCSMDEAVFCSTDKELSFAAFEEQSYILILEPIDAASTGEVDIDLNITPLVCLPVGGTTCEGTTLKQCGGGGTSTTDFTCGETCNGDVCGADTCDAAVEVTSFPYTFSSAADAYNSHINYNQPNSCLNPDAGMIGGNMGGMEPLPTPGQDVMFKLPGLKAGQRVTVDASTAVGNLADSAIFISRDCADVMSCLYAKDMGDKVDAWEVPTDGDYFVTVDRTLSNLSEIKVTINVE